MWLIDPPNGGNLGGMKNLTKKYIAKRIRITMTTSEVSGIQMAKAMGVTQNTVSDYRTYGTANILIINKMAQVCGVSLAELLEIS